MALTQRVFPLKGVVQHYNWGGFDFIPELLSIANKDQQPFAEYWLGAHPNHPSKIGDDSSADLADLISKQPALILGQKLAKEFSTLPYLFKVLDVRKMLSIQVHPQKDSAEKGFAEENKKGIPLTASHRNYKDDNHKPEMMLALGDFWLLHGFKKENDLSALLEDVAELRFLKPVFDLSGYRGLYEKVMRMPQDEVNTNLQPLIEEILPRYHAGELKKDEEDFWAARAVVDFCKDGNYDRGIFSIYFFNLLHLKKGEAIYQGAGLPHAYLEGQNIELMANSDNVLRAGLTDKFIDVEELLKHVKFEATHPQVLEGQLGHTRIFHTPALEFELHQYNLSAGDTITIESHAPEILLNMEGAATVTAGDERREIKKGEALLLIASTRTILTAASKAMVFGATVPRATKN